MVVHKAQFLHRQIGISYCSKSLLILQLELHFLSVIPTGWKKIWCINVIPRIKLFILKACSNSLPTKANLYKRRCLEDPICELCGQEAKIMDHILLHLAATQLVWYNNLFRVDTKNLEGVSFKEFFWSSTDKRSPEYVSMLLNLAWEYGQHLKLNTLRS